jgi:hypothetical protein
LATGWGPSPRIPSTPRGVAMPLNEAFGWIWVLTGFLSGLLLGLRFHADSWLGGYAALRRRLVRLGHVSFIGLGILNLLFAAGAPRLRLDPAWLSVASWCLVLGGIAMPACCALMAWRPGLRHVFAVPVVALVLGAGVIVAGVIGP